MGWSSWSSTWNDNDVKFNEGYVKAQADVMAAKLKSSGYVYVNLDAGWDKGFDAHGRPQTNAAKFPGIAALAAYVHGKGLKLGIYLQPGIDTEAWKANGTVEGTTIHLRDIADTSQQGSTTGHAYRIDFSRPGAREYVQSWAHLLASWGVDYIKMDFVGPGGGNVKADTREELQRWHEAIQKTGRPIWLEISNSLDIANIDTWRAASNGWRIDGDIEAYDKNGNLTRWSKVRARCDDVPAWVKFAGPGGWNDLDSLEIGQGDRVGLTPDERRTAMTLWAISCSPLILGPDLTKLEAGDLALLTNPEVLAVDQAGHPAAPLSQKKALQVWWARNPDDSLTVALFNLGDAAATTAVTWSDLDPRFSGAVALRDLWQRRDLPGGSTYETTLQPHACQLLKVRRAPTTP